MDIYMVQFFFCIGIGFAAQQCEYIPNEAHDQALDAYVCETGITAFSARARATLAPFLNKSHTG